MRWPVAPSLFSAQSSPSRQADFAGSGDIIDTMSKKAKVGHSRLGPRQTFVLAQLRIQPNNLWYYGCGWGYARRRDMESILDALHNKGLVTLHYDKQGRAVYTLGLHVGEHL